MGVLKIQTFSGEEKRVGKLLGFRGHGALTISESGLHKLIMRSGKPRLSVVRL